MNAAIISKSFMVRETVAYLFKNIYDYINTKLLINSKELYDCHNIYYDFIFIDADSDKMTEDEIEGIISNKMDSKIIILDYKNKKQLFVNAVKLGVDAYITNIEDKREFKFILEKIKNEKKYYDLNLIRETIQKKECNLTKLTSREREVLYYVSEGISNKEVGSMLNITDYTVKKHIGSILNKLNLYNRKDIIIFIKENYNGKEDIISC